jgi:hypothetical protein
VKDSDQTIVVVAVAPVDAARSVDLPSEQPEHPLTVDPTGVRLVDPAPSPDPTSDETPLSGPSFLTQAEPALSISPDADRTAAPAAARISPWSVPSPAGERVAFCFNLAKATGQGEDADPILREARGLGLVGVFDGMGGAGGTDYATSEGSLTGAYLASRAAREVVDARMLDVLQGTDEVDISTIASSLHDSIESALRTRLAELHAPRSGLRSKLLRALPTTMAMAALKRRDGVDDTWECHLLWAGDSRVYLLRPGSGAAQLTTDDIRDQGDAMANLRQDSVISNAMSADTPFVVNHRQIVLSTPFVIVAATDGCFGYLPSPMHFEWLLLSTLRRAPDAESWSELLQAQIAAISGDDASMAVLGVGSDHQGFRLLFADRSADLHRRWVLPLEQLDASVADLERQLDDLRRQQTHRTAELWTAYRPDYELYFAVDAPGKDAR